MLYLTNECICYACKKGEWDDDIKECDMDKKSIFQFIYFFMKNDILIV